MQQIQRHNNSRHNFSNSNSSSNSSSSGHFMTIDRYSKLAPSVKSVCNAFPTDMKAITLKNAPTCHNVTSQRKQTFDKSKFRKALLHEFLTDFEEDDYVASSDDNKDALDYHTDRTIPINSATSKKVKPTDIHSIMHVPDKQLTTKNKYNSINKHIIYSTSKLYRLHDNSLVDRGVNGGMAGSDVRVCHDNPDR